MLIVGKCLLFCEISTFHTLGAQSQINPLNSKYLGRTADLLSDPSPNPRLRGSIKTLWVRGEWTIGSINVTTIMYHGAYCPGQFNTYYCLLLHLLEWLFISIAVEIHGHQQLSLNHFHDFWAISEPF